MLASPWLQCITAPAVAREDSRSAASTGSSTRERPRRALDKPPSAALRAIKDAALGDGPTPIVKLLTKNTYSRFACDLERRAHGRDRRAASFCHLGATISPPSRHHLLTQRSRPRVESRRLVRQRRDVLAHGTPRFPESSHAPGATRAPIRQRRAMSIRTITRRGSGRWKHFLAPACASRRSINARPGRADAPMHRVMHRAHDPCASFAPPNDAERHHEVLILVNINHEEDRHGLHKYCAPLRRYSIASRLSLPLPIQRK